MGGWLLPIINSKLLVLLIPAVYANWLVDDNKCLLTRAEHYYLDKESTKGERAIEYKGFINGICMKYNIYIKDDDMHKLLVGLSFHSFIQSYKNIVF